jgi:hypothetical protein
MQTSCNSPIHIIFVNYFLCMLSEWDPALKLSGLCHDSGEQRHQNEYFRPQRMQSAELSELELPQPLTRRRVCPSPVLGGGAHSLAREGLGESQFRRGDIHCGTLYIYVLCVSDPLAGTIGDIQ